MNDSVEWGKSCPNVEVDNFRRDGVLTLPLESLPGRSPALSWLRWPHLSDAGYRGVLNITVVSPGENCAARLNVVKIFSCQVGGLFILRKGLVWKKCLIDAHRAMGDGKISADKFEPLEYLVCN